MNNVNEKIIIITVRYSNDTMFQSFHLKIIFLENSSNNSSHGFLVAIISHWYVPHGHHKSKLC